MLMKDNEASIELANRISAREGMCTLNSLRGMKHIDGFLVEGWVTFKVIPNGIKKMIPLTPFEHTWIENDAIIDPSLPNDDLLYFPVFRHDRKSLLDFARKNETMKFPTYRMNNEAKARWSDMNLIASVFSLAEETGFMMSFGNRLLLRFKKINGEPN